MKSVLNINWKEWCWSWSSNTLVTWYEEPYSSEKTLMLGKIEGGRRRNDRGWDGSMASLIWWTWVWAGSGSWWWTGKPGLLESMGSQSQTQLSNWTELNWEILETKNTTTKMKNSLARLDIRMQRKESVNLKVEKNLPNLNNREKIDLKKVNSASGTYQRRQWHPPPVLLPGKSHGWRSLVGCSPWGR